MAGKGLAQVSQLISGFSEVLNFGAPTAVGLSIGSSAVKIAELKKKGKSWKLLHFGMAALPEDSIVNREIVNAVSISDAIKSLIAQIKLKNKNVASAISGTSLIIKRMMLDVPNAREIQEQVFWEAEQYLPFDVTEVVMDYHVLSRGKDNKTDVVFVAVKRNVLDSYMASVEDGGLKPKIMDTDFFALQNVFEANYTPDPAKAVALADVGASGLKLLVVHNGVPTFTKDSAIGGRSLTAEIQKNLNLSYADAEALKINGQGGGEGGAPGMMPQEVSDLMQVMADNLALEIKKAIDFYNASSFGAPIEYILLSGGTAKIPGFSKIVEDSTQLPAQMLNPFTSIATDPAVFSEDYLASIAPYAAIPIGLALRAGSGR